MLSLLLTLGKCIYLKVIFYWVGYKFILVLWSVDTTTEINWLLSELSTYGLSKTLRYQFHKFSPPVILSSILLHFISQCIDHITAKIFNYSLLNSLLLLLFSSYVTLLNSSVRVSELIFDLFLLSFFYVIVLPWKTTSWVQRNLS
jgi:hypothetical protein